MNPDEPLVGIFISDADLAEREKVKAIRKVIADVLPELKARGHFELANEAMDLLEGTDMNVSLEQEGSHRHEAVLDAVATHSRGPDAEASGVQQREARERDVQRRDADKLSARDGAFQREADNKQNIRSAAWKAMAEAKQNAARADAGGAHTGAPRDWHISAKGEWDRLPDQTKLAVKRSQAAQNEISQALDSVRPVLKQQGMSDVQVLSS